MERYTVVCDDDIADRVELLATEYDLTPEAVIRQLLSLGLENID